MSGYGIVMGEYYVSGYGIVMGEHYVSGYGIVIGETLFEWLWYSNGWTLCE